MIIFMVQWLVSENIDMSISSILTVFQFSLLTLAYHKQSELEGNRNRTLDPFWRRHALTPLRHGRSIK